MTSINLPRHHDLVSVPAARRASLPATIRRLPRHAQRLQRAFATPASPTEEALHAVREVRPPHP